MPVLNWYDLSPVMKEGIMDECCDEYPECRCRDDAWECCSTDDDCTCEMAEDEW